ncbi:hypothetical protein EB001_11500 [bacterium]|nr:hypothetical protein [bacterium]
MSYDQGMWHQAQLERQQMLIQALSRAANGIATPDDWNIIRYECGLSDGQFREVRFNTNLGEENGISSEINGK